MKKPFFIAIVLLVVTACGQVKYKLQKVYENADLNYHQLDSIDAYSSSMDSVKYVFDPVSGNYKVYKFIATFKGISAPEGKTRKFHDILVVKTDSTGIILDAYQYTLEWAEPPHQYDVFRSTVSGLKLHDGLPIGDLQLKRTLITDWEEEIEHWFHEDGILRF